MNVPPLIVHTALASAIGAVDGIVNNWGTVRENNLGLGGHVANFVREDIPHIVTPLAVAQIVSGVDINTTANVMMGSCAMPEQAIAMNILAGAVSAIAFALRHRHQGSRGAFVALYGGAYMYAIGSNWGIIPAVASHLAYNIAAEAVSREI